MSDDKPTYQERLKGSLHSERSSAPPSNKDHDAEGVKPRARRSAICAASVTAATSVEFRFRDGNSMWFPYSWMGTWQYNPSEGLLLKFSGDLVYLVLIRGSNLDQPLKEGSINLTRGGLQRHRVLWLCEMTNEDIRRVGETGPTIDSIEVAEFESHDALKEWLSTKSSAFVP